MKNKTVLMNAMVALLLAASSLANAQTTEENIVPRIGGFGMKFSILGLNDVGLTGPDAGGGKVFFASLNASKNFRVEPEFGFSNSKTPSGQSGIDLNSKAKSYGLSAFGMLQRGNANFYAGPTYSIYNAVNDQLTSTWNPNPPYNVVYSSETIKSKGNKFGLILGAEYFFNRHFSLGAEVGYMHSNYTPNTDKSDVSKSSYTNGNLVLRGYF